MTVDEAVDIQSALKTTAENVSHALDARLSKLVGFPPNLLEAMRYSLLGGKRLRPVLVLWTCELCGGDTSWAMPAALAIECVHTFSLIHDDLPALDADDYRRGRLTNHRRFGEALAILAGDALSVLAFDIISSDVADEAVAIAMTRELSRATGGAGMIGGELMDLESETLAPDSALVASIHSAKTARLMQAACRLGGIAAGANHAKMAALSAFGHELGLAFQAVDDLLDIEGTLEETGKQTGKDTAAGKQTYPRAVGLEESRRIAAEAAERAASVLLPLGDKTGRLTALTKFVVERKG